MFYGCVLWAFGEFQRMLCYCVLLQKLRYQRQRDTEKTDRRREKNGDRDIERVRQRDIHGESYDTLGR